MGARILTWEEKAKGELAPPWSQLALLGCDWGTLGGLNVDRALDVERRVVPLHRLQYR